MEEHMGEWDLSTYKRFSFIKWEASAKEVNSLYKQLGRLHFLDLVHGTNLATDKEGAILIERMVHNLIN